MSEQDDIYRCHENKEAICKKRIHEEDEIDPRSYCHNICATPQHVCGKTTCDKFISKEPEGDKVICVPTRKCNIIKHFGPETESFIKRKTAKERFAALKKSDEDEKKELQDLLNKLKDLIDPEGMAAIYALAGSDICPCCKCKICECKLRDVDSQTLLDERKRRLGGDSLDDLGLTEEQKRLIRERRKTGGFGYSFDYFYQPDLEAFETRRRLIAEKERQEQIEQARLAQQQEEEERIRREEEEARLEAEMEEKAVQARPEAQEEESQFYGKIQRPDLLDDLSDKVSTKVEMWEKPEENADWREYKAAEWAGVRHQDLPTVVEAKTAEMMEQIAARERMSVTSQASRRSTRPSVLKTPLAHIDLQLHAFDKSWLEDTEKLSLVPTSVLDKIEEEEPSLPEKVEKPKDYSQGPVLRAPTAEIRPEMIPLMGKTSLIIEEGAMEGEGMTDEYEMYKEKFLTDVCQCLPGYCICGKQHYLFKKDKETEDFGMGFKTFQVDKMVQSAKDDGKISEFSDVSSCSCIHSDEELKITPVGSRVELVAAPPPPIFETKSEKSRRFITCTRPKYQKTLVIVKPEAVRFKDVIFRAIQREGLDVVDERIIQLTPEQVAEIYTENIGSAYFPMFVQQLSSSPVLVIAIAGSNAIQRWNRLVGSDRKIPVSWFYPASMRRRFSVHHDVLDVMQVSDDFERAKPEIRYFFPLHIIDPIIISSTMVQDYCDEFIHPTLLKGLVKLVKQKPVDPVGFLAEWLLINNPFQPFYKQINVSLART